MKRLFIILAAVAACSAFIACDKKPLDEIETPVVIPDGIYDETAHVIMYVDRTPYEPYHKDTTISTIVIIENGEFTYPFLCQDSVWKYTNYEDSTIRDSTISYNGHFIFSAVAYCPLTIRGTVRKRRNPIIKNLPNGTIEMRNIAIRFYMPDAFYGDTIQAIVQQQGHEYYFQYERYSGIYNIQSQWFHSLTAIKQE